MSHDTRRSSSHLSRRTALSGVGAAAALGLGHLDRAAAQDATPAPLATHPLAGTWLAMPEPASALRSSPRTAPSSWGGPSATSIRHFRTSTWSSTPPASAPGSPSSEQQGHFTVVAVLSDAKGTYLGTATVEGHPLVSRTGRPSAIVSRRPGSPCAMRRTRSSPIKRLRGGRDGDPDEPEFGGLPRRDVGSRHPDRVTHPEA